NDLGSDLDGSSPSGFLANLPPVIDTLLPFSSENKDRVFNHGVLASKEKSPPSLSHRGSKASKLFLHKSLMIARIVKTLVLVEAIDSLVPLDEHLATFQGY
ncbi:hypothetical protein Tco_0948777, partial [Tanacetum coccineum]